MRGYTTRRFWPLMIGSASARVTKQSESGRKLAKTHQNVLDCFAKATEQDLGSGLRCWDEMPNVEVTGAEPAFIGGASALTAVLCFFA